MANVVANTTTARAPTTLAGRETFAACSRKDQKALAPASASDLHARAVPDRAVVVLLWQQSSTSSQYHNTVRH